jgi:D-alanyl-lipoteichoic acid acyltransferase DltB (MBOAT superfamily)
MLFPTIEFAVFFAIVFPVAWLLNERNSAKKWFLVGASYVFYAVWSTHYLLILFGSSLGNFALALLLGRLSDGPLRRAALWLGIVVNLGVLGYFKYYNFFVAAMMDLLSILGVRADLHFIEVALPIAISFLTFHALSYLIDVYDRRLAPSRSLVDILLYISFFPHLIAGPIVRARIFLEQTFHASDPKGMRIGASVFLILGGLFKKVIVANYLSTDFVDAVFRSPGDQSSLDLLLGMYAYAIQIYCDFSAYTDIAIGVADLLGYRFPQNFDQPYRALTVQDFWRRWHITLSSWLRDYVYVRLGGSRQGQLATWRNIMITMGLGGLWHGASVNFIVWGLLHGSALVLERAAGITGGGADCGRGALRGVAGWLVTFHFVCFTWVFFRSPTIESSLVYVRALFSGVSFGTTITPLVAAMLVCGGVTQIVPRSMSAGLETWYDSSPLAVKVAVPAVVIFLICVASPNGVPPFIYFQF